MQEKRRCNAELELQLQKTTGQFQKTSVRKNSKKQTSSAPSQKKSEKKEDDDEKELQAWAARIEATYN